MTLINAVLCMIWYALNNFQSHKVTYIHQSRYRHFSLAPLGTIHILKYSFVERCVSRNRLGRRGGFTLTLGMIPYKLKPILFFFFYIFT